MIFVDSHFNPKVVLTQNYNLKVFVVEKYSHVYKGMFIAGLTIIAKAGKI